MQRKMMGSIGNSDLVYSEKDNNKNESWEWKPDGKNSEDLSWLIK